MKFFWEVNKVNYSLVRMDKNKWSLNVSDASGAATSKIVSEQIALGFITKQIGG
jgi:hypothetical protein